MEKLWKIIEVIVRWCLKILFKILHKELTEETSQAFLQFVKFGLVGVSNTVISYGLYAGSLLLMKKTGLFPGFDYYVAQVIAFVLSVAWSFYWNNKYVFTKEEHESRSILPALLKTYVSYSFTGLFLNTILLYLWVDLMGISEFIAPVINLLISVPVNFLLNKFWAFKTKPEEAQKVK